MSKTKVVLVLCLLHLCSNAATTVDPNSLEHTFSIPDYKRTMNMRPLSVEFVDYFYNMSTEILLPDHPAFASEEQHLKCLSELNYVVEAANLNKIWAMRMLDAWGSIPSGLLYGNTKDLGNYDECIKIRKEITTGNYLSGKYCLAQLPVKTFLNMSSLLDSMKISSAICFPASCSGDHIDMLLKQLFKQLLHVDYPEKLVNEDKCKTSDHEPLDSLTIFTIVILSVFCGLMVLATLYDYFLCDDQKNLPKLIKAFSARANSRALFRFVDSKSNPNVIDSLHGIRCLSLVWVVFGHDYIIAVYSPNQNMVNIYNWYEQPFSMLIIHAVYSVDTFFFLSGLLVAMVALRAMERQKGKLNVPLMYLHRYLRLTPVVAIAILCYMNLLEHMGDGPLWANVKMSNYNFCADTWFYTLLYVHNYATKNMCLSHTWYLAVDMQLYIISPLLLIAVYKWGKKAIAGIVIFLLLLASCLFSMMVIKHYAMEYKGGFSEHSQKKIYYSTHTRASPWLIGFIFGYFLHINRGKTFKLNPPKVWLGWIISLAFFFTCIFALYPDTKWSVPALSHVGEAFYLTFTRIAWPLGLCWVVFACMQGYGGMANSFLSSPMWQPLSRLSYCIYIWHFYIQNINVGRTRTNTFFSDYDVMLRFWADFGLTVLLGFFIYIVVEAPLGGLQSMLIPERRPKTTQPGEQTKPSIDQAAEEDNAPAPSLGSKRILESEENSTVPAAEQPQPPMDQSVVEWGASAPLPESKGTLQKEEKETPLPRAVSSA